ncbi:unnamed protein product, partial [marine sediment metagenome]
TFYTYRQYPDYTSAMAGHRETVDTMMIPTP